MSDNFKELCVQIISILHDVRYGIPSQRLHFMKTLANRTAVLRIEKTLADYPVELFDELGNSAGVLPVKSISQVIDAPPIWSGNSWRNVVPTVILAGQSSQTLLWTTIHEMCHLLSIGPYIQDERHCWHHHFGILEYDYQSSCKQLVQTFSQGHVGINELITDYITWKIINCVFRSEAPLYSGIERFKQYLESCCSTEEIYMLAGGYFSGNTSRVQEILFCQAYDSYNSLYSAMSGFNYGT